MNNNDNVLIGKRIRELRQKRNWKQSDLALQLGISQPDVSRIETGKISCTNNIYQIVSVLKIKIDDLIDGINPQLRSELEFAYKRELTNTINPQPQLLQVQPQLPEITKSENCSNITLIINKFWERTSEQKIVIRDAALKLMIAAFSESDPDLAQKQLNAVAALLS